MIVRERKYEECGECHTRKLVQEEAHGCDRCNRIIDLAKNARYHKLSVFQNASDSRSKEHIFCSVKCVIGWLRAFRPPKDFYFMSLPLFEGKRDFNEFQKHLKRSATE